MRLLFKAVLLTCAGFAVLAAFVWLVALWNSYCYHRFGFEHGFYIAVMPWVLVLFANAVRFTYAILSKKHKETS